MKEKYNLIKLFSEYETIEIPKIQRDYAQGREEEIEVRKRFLDNIFSNLINNKTLELDFIYGSKYNNTLYLLDGQQRITTLFLLYWYLAFKELDSFDIIMCLRNFTYSTRVSSRDFCKNLISKIKYIKESAINYEKLSEKLKEYSWLINYKDPTINAMLNMIDAIDEKYKDKNINGLFNNLENITFYVLPLEDFKLTDEIYIKMNARGKPLTDFENFKADLINWVKDENNELKFKFKEYTTYNGYEISYKEEISMKLDNEWTDLFWSLSKDYKNRENIKKQIFDNLFLKFFYRITLNYLIIDNISDKTNKDIVEESDYKILFNEEKYSNFDAFKNTFHKNYNEIFKILNFLSENENYKIIIKDIIPLWKKNKKEDCNIFLNDSFEYIDRIILVAFMLYFQKNSYEYKQTKFIRWMRIIWNIFEHFQVAEYNIVGAIKLIDELSNYSSNIYSFLADEKIKIKSDLAKDYIEFERKKCRFIIKDNIWEEEFKELEKHPFLRGYIDFLIDNNMDIDKFKHRKNFIYDTFDKDGICYKLKENHLLLRALISNINSVVDLPGRYSDIGDDFRSLIRDKKFHDAKKNNEEYKMNILIRGWFDNSVDINDLIMKLEELVNKDSKIKINDDKNKEERIRIAHESLYKNNELIKWMQDTSSYNIKWDYGNIYICKDYARYNRVLIGSYRNILIKKYLIKKYSFEDKDNFEIPYNSENKIGYFGCFDIAIYGIGYKFYFDRWNYLYIYKSIKNNNEYKDVPIKEYNLNDCSYKYIIEKLEKEIFSKEQ